MRWFNEYKTQVITSVTPPPSATEVNTALDNKVTLNTNQTIAGKKYFNNEINIDAVNVSYEVARPLNYASLNIAHAGLTSKGDTLSDTSYASIYFTDRSGNHFENNAVGLIESKIDSSGKTSTYIRAMRNISPFVSGSFSDLGISLDLSGNTTTFAPTPDTSDNSRQIATTAFVNNRLPYRTGTWTPVLKGATTAGELTYTTRSGVYIKIGRYVFIQCTIQFNGYTTHPVGSVQISGLPFTSSGLSYLTIGGVGTAGFYRLIRAFTENSSVLNCQLCKLSAAGVPDFDNAIFDTSRDTGPYIQLNTTDTSTIKASGVYIVA